MSPDYPLLQALATSLDTRMIVYKAGHEITAILDGEPHEAGYLKGLHDGFYRIVPDPRAEIGNLVEFTVEEALAILYRAGLIVPEGTFH